MVIIYYQTKKHQKQAVTHQLGLPANVNCLHYLQTQLIFRYVSYIM